LKIGRPKNASGPIPKPSDLACGNPNFQGGGSTVNTGNKNKKNSTTEMVKQALTAGKRMLNPAAYSESSQAEADAILRQAQQPDCTIIVENFPETHSLAEVTKICGVFGMVKYVDL
jgi:3-dehydroquinate dehydratase